jgi:hypothetical protein
MDMDKPLFYYRVRSRVRDASASVRDFWKRYEREIVWWAVTVLAGAVAFEGGLVQGRSVQPEPLVIEKPVGSCGEPPPEASSGTAASGQDGAAHPLVPKGPDPQAPGSCLFVGSRNSTKYHAPSCPVAKRIKPENQVCFASEGEAQAKGYQAGCLK